VICWLKRSLIHRANLLSEYAELRKCSEDGVEIDARKKLKSQM
jgi:hypothetical protein